MTNIKDANKPIILTPQNNQDEVNTDIKPKSSSLIIYNHAGKSGFRKQFPYGVNRVELDIEAGIATFFNQHEVGYTRNLVFYQPI